MQLLYVTRHANGDCHYFYQSHVIWHATLHGQQTKKETLDRETVTVHIYLNPCLAPAIPPTSSPNCSGVEVLLTIFSPAGKKRERWAGTDSPLSEWQSERSKNNGQTVAIILECARIVPVPGTSFRCLLSLALHRSSPDTRTRRPFCSDTLIGERERIPFGKQIDGETLGVGPKWLSQIS